MVRQLRGWSSVYFVVLSLLVLRSSSKAISLDSDGDIKLGVRTYANARVGTEDTHLGVLIPAKDPTTSTSGTFPISDAGHLRQNRFFIEVELNHDLDRLVKEGVGPFSLLNDLPFKVKGLGYHATFRGEGDGVYDWGPKEFSTATQFKEVQQAVETCKNGKCTQTVTGQTIVDVAGAREQLRHLGVDRERLFQAYVEGNVGSLFVRMGRQILSWGETDSFQLLDHINPTDSSFGGFLVPLDERRLPLDMALANYYLGDAGPFSEAHLEGFAAIDNSVGFYPGTPAGSPWGIPSLGAPSNSTENFLYRPARTINNTRGGFQLKFNAMDATFGLAHYYTYFDTEALKVVTNGPSITTPFHEGLPCNVGDTSGNCGYPAHALHSAPKVQVSGASTTFAVPQIYSVMRSEVAYFKDEPAFNQGQLDPFIFNAKGLSTGERRMRDSFNAVVGFDTNQWVRFLNANQTFFISTQFFYKHILNAGGHNIYKADGTTLNPGREVLPVDLNVVAPSDAILHQLGKVEPLFITQPSNQYLQTLFIGTSYRSGEVSPSLSIFYDWGGAFVYQPAVVFSRDPFRFLVDYSIIDAHEYKGGSGISLLKDRDNVQFRVEYDI